MKKALLSTVFLSLAACGGGSGGTTTTTSAGTTTSGTGTGTGTTTTTTGSTGHSTTTASSTSSGTGTATTTGTGTGSSATAGSATTSTGGTQTIPPTCTTTITTLLVDNDNSDNNNGTYSDAGDDFTPSVSDITFAAVLQDAGIPYAYYQVPGSPSSQDTHPSANDLTNCKTIYWYTGAVQGDGTATSINVSSAQDAALVNWVNGGGKTLVFFSEGLVWDLEGNGSDNEWTGVQAPIDPMFNEIGAAGADADQDETDDILSTGTVVSWALPNVGMDDAGWNIIQGGEGLPAWGIGTSGNLSYPDFDNLGLILPDAGIDTLATVVATVPTGSPITAAVATGNKHAGTAATSTVVYVGFPVEDYLSQPGQENTPYDFFSGVNRYITGH